jgi:uncharacterized repeat protein (TIGR01451 family)
MFEKLVSLIPYNPSLAHQLSFYGKRMREEAAIRRTGLVFIVLAFFVQFFAVLSPPVPTTASSSTDLINGGITSKSQAVSACTSNLKYYKTIMANYGITCNDIAAATTIQLKSTAYNNTLYTMGWNPDGARNPYTGKPTNEQPATLTGISHTFYWHLVSNTDKTAYRYREALQLKSSVTGKTFYILYDCGNLVSIGIPATIKPCQYNSAILSTDARCIKPCAYNTSIPSTDSRCHPAPCPLSPNIYITDANCKACPYDASILKSNVKCVQCPNPRYPTVTASSPECKQMCPYNNAYDVGDANCKPCTDSLNSTDTLACVKVSKTASDPTQNWPDANNKTAQAGDTIIYVLNAKNQGKADVTGFVMQENLNDVMDYADLVDLHGGTLTKETGMVSWPATDIKAGATLSNSITVKVKNPIPSTPVSTSDPSHFDLVMVNVYGNSITINLVAPLVKVVEQTTTTLVNTGPGTSLFMASVVVVLAGYFYGRARLLARESSLAVQGNTGA